MPLLSLKQQQRPLRSKCSSASLCWANSNQRRKGYNNVRSLFGCPRHNRVSSVASAAPAFALHQSSCEVLGHAQAMYKESGLTSELGWPCNFSERFHLQYMIGRGTFGRVWEARCNLTGKQVAVKIIAKQRPGVSRSKVLKAIENEADLFNRCQKSMYVAQLYGAYEDEDNCYLVQELCQGGDLRELLEAHGPLSEAEAATVMRGVLDVMVECHRNGICYGDVKPANFLLSKPFSAITGLEIKAVDFGCSQESSNCLCLRKRVGTPAYMAPEMFMNLYGPKVDVWGAGVLLYQLLTNKLPFWQLCVSELRHCPPHEIMCGVLSNPVILSGAMEHVSQEAKSLISMMLERDPEQRVTALAALQHPWFHKQLGCEPVPTGAVSGGEAP